MDESLASTSTAGRVRRRRVRPGTPTEPVGLDRRRLLSALTRLKRGDFTVRLDEAVSGVDGKISEAFNEVVDLNRRVSVELLRLSRLVGKEGRISERASLGDVQGSWAASVRSVNALIADLVRPTIETSRVIGAVAKGDLSQTMDLESEGRPLQGEFLRTAKTVNTMVDQLSLLRLGGDPRGPRGRHRGQARRPGGGQGRRRAPGRT